MSKFYSVYIWKTIEQDDFKDGCIPDTFQQIGEVFKFQSSDLALVTARVREFIDLKDCNVFENKLEVSRLETDSGDEPSAACLDAWKRGPRSLKVFNTKIWNASYTVHLETVETTEICAGQLLDGGK